MKLIFFVVGCILVMIRVYFSFSGRSDSRDGHANILIKSDNFEERIGWQGTINLNDSENAIISMSPGAYVKFIRNDTAFAAESNVKGEITYTFDNPLDLTATQRAMVVRAAIAEMVHYGFNAEARMDAIYKRGGYTALIEELQDAKLDDLQERYLKRILAADSLSRKDLLAVLTIVKNNNSDDTKNRLLEMVSPAQLDSLDVLTGYLDAVGSMHNDDQQRHAFERLFDAHTLSDTALSTVITAVPGIGDDDQRLQAYKRLIEKDSLSEQQWALVLDQAASLNEEDRRAELLVAAAARMPRTDSLHGVYLRAARSLSADDRYGRVLRAINNP